MAPESFTRPSCLKSETPYTLTSRRSPAPIRNLSRFFKALGISGWSFGSPADAAATGSTIVCEKQDELRKARKTVDQANLAKQQRRMKILGDCAKFSTRESLNSAIPSTATEK